ncbi:MAG: septal ring lytic transglycosylase RlpA family protein [Pedobacter sp.]|nr:septal ring lytic transglycosylase RlpA family protein [Chitinophagaceae bacterium]
MQKKIVFILIFILMLSACRRKTVPESSGKTDTVTETGYASYYADNLNGHSTASGEAYNSSKMTAAHKKIPFGTIVTVTNLSTGKQVTVRVNDRGPFVSGRIIDLSKAAAKQIGMVGAGIVKVKIAYRRK